MIIGLTGYGRTGKDTVGKILVEEHGFTRLAFADGVREAALALDPIIECPGTLGPVSPFDAVPKRLSVVLRTYDGWEGVKAETTPHIVRNEIRRILQNIGTEAGWKLHGLDLWANLLFRKWAVTEGFKPVVITDVRFPHEADAIRSRGVPGFVVRIYRNEIGPLNDHASETMLDRISADWYLQNHGTIDDLRENIALMLANLKETL